MPPSIPTLFKLFHVFDNEDICFEFLQGCGVIREPHLCFNHVRCGGFYAKMSGNNNKFMYQCIGT